MPHVLPYWVVVEGHSMLPDYRPSDLLLVVPLPTRPQLLGLLLRKLVLRRGMPVLVRPTAHLRRVELKRVQGMPGDVETWGWGPSRRHGPVPAGHVFVVGTGSDRGIPPADSRSYGPVPVLDLIGIVVRTLPRGGVGRNPDAR